MHKENLKYVNIQVNTISTFHIGSNTMIIISIALMTLVVACQQKNTIIKPDIETTTVT